MECSGEERKLEGKRGEERKGEERRVGVVMEMCRSRGEQRRGGNV